LRCCYIAIVEILGQNFRMQERNMGEVIRFIPNAERERARLIREARAIYESIFPSADPVSERQDKAPASNLLSVANANAFRSDGAVS
jgi:hypothetical protein